MGYFLRANGDPKGYERPPLASAAIKYGGTSGSPQQIGGGRTNPASTKGVAIGAVGQHLVMPKRRSEGPQGRRAIRASQLPGVGRSGSNRKLDSKYWDG